MAPQVESGLPPRLRRVAEHVPPDWAAADIGADHGLLTVHLAQSGPQRRVVATDLREQPLQRTRAAVAKLPHALQERVSLRQGPGLSVLKPGEVQAVVMAGLGGSTMVEILGQSPDVTQKLRRLVLQPMQGTLPLRRWLVQNGWQLAWEELVDEGEHLYLIMVAEPGREPEHDPVKMEVGPRLLERPDPLVGRWIRLRMARYHHMIEEMERGLGSADPRVRRHRRRLLRLKELLGHVDTCG